MGSCLIIKLLPSLSFRTRNLCQATAKVIAACSFKAIVRGPCCYDRRDQTKPVNELLLLSCVKDIERRKSLWSFTGVFGEQELILLRTGIFTTHQDVSDPTICPFHCSELGTGWRRSSIHVEFQTRLHITFRVKEIQSL